MMKRLVSMTLLLILSLGVGWAQRKHKHPREQIQKTQREYLIRSLELTPKETEALMPILEELDKQRFQLWKEGHALREQYRKNAKDMSQAELKAYWEQILSERIKFHELERDFYRKCEAVLPLEKLVRLPESNRRFAKKHVQQKRKDGRD